MARKSRYAASAQETASERTVYRAAQYGRLSVEDGDDVERNSIGNQRKIAEQFAMGRDDLAIVEHYFDHGYSGMDYDRPDFQRMMRDAERGAINCVIVKDISRFGRDFVSTGEYVERILPAMGVRLICIHDSYDSAEEGADAGGLMLPLKMVMNDSYARDISRKIRSGISAKMNSGTFLPAAGSVPYGYLRNPSAVTYDVDAEAAETVQRIYALRAQGFAFNEIARRLNADGIPSPGRLRYERGWTRAEAYRNALWLWRTVQKISCDPAYLGHRVHGKLKRDRLGQGKTERPEESWQIIENAHPAIVTQELFERVQRVNREERSKRERYGACSAAPEDFRSLLRGKIVCGECGRPLIGAKGCARPNAAQGSRVFFDCSAYRSSNHIRCTSHYIRQETILRALRHTLDQQVKIAVDLEEMLRAAPRGGGGLSGRQRSLYARRQGIENRIEALVYDLADGLIDRDTYVYAKKRYSEQRAQLRAEEAAVEERIRTAEEQLCRAEQWLAALRRYETLPAIDRPLLELLVRQIRVFQDKSVRIELNYADPYRPLRACRDLYAEEHHAV